MPNNIKNLLIVKSGNKVVLNHFLNEIKGECEVIDFNTIIPMPKEYEGIASSSETDKAIEYFLYKNNRTDEAKAMFRYFAPNMHNFIETYNTQGKTFQERVLELGQKCVENFYKYGAKDWYDWCCNNWETKWNAYEQSIEYLSDKKVEISFETAWSGVPNLIEKLSSKFPSLTFIYKFADESMGYNCGVGGTLDDGTWIFEYESEQSDTAMDLYIECHKENKDDFYKDELGRWHNRNWEEDDE